MLDELIGQLVVVDFGGSFVCLGTFMGCDQDFFDLRDADLHDLRDTNTSRETYIAESVATGIKRNRKRVLLFRRDVVAIARLEDVVDE